MPITTKTLLLSLLLLTLHASSQKKEELFDYAFKPTTGGAQYYVTTEKSGDRWHREAYYLPDGSMALDAWYKDADCKIAEGETSWYHENKKLKSRCSYVNGNKDGLWITYHENGMMNDSATYANGKLKGIKLGWEDDGTPSDSSNWDGAGNGVEVNWYTDGMPRSAGRWVADTAKDKRWKYFHPNGTVMATEDYDKGKRIAINCFDENGVALTASACEENEASFPGGEKGWRKFLEKNLNGDVPVNNRVRDGIYTVLMQFVVEKDGSLSGLTAKTHHGFGMEAEVMRLLKVSPKWIPARQFGRPVKAYRIQPVTFQVTTE